MSESIEQVIDTNAQPVSEQSSEDKFFGVASEINTSPVSEVEVEVIDERPAEDIRPAKVETNEAPVDDDTVDKEIADYSKRAGDRISKIKYEYHEERRAKEQALRESQEATKVLKNLMSENERLQSVVTQGGDVLNQQALNNAQWAKYNAQQKFKKAYEEGDADGMAKAQELLSKATLAEQQAGQTAQQVQSQIVANLPEVEQQPVQAPQRQLDPDMEKWANNNPWFMGQEPFQREMTSYALTMDQRLRNRGVLPESKSEEYYAEVDKAMRNEFPSFFGVQATNDSEMVIEKETSKRQPQTVVASATRDSGNKKPTQIRLSQTQVKLARQLGISPEQYANQLLKEI